MRTNEYFIPSGVIKITLWKDNQQNEAKPFGESRLLLSLYVRTSPSFKILMRLSS